jgi:hypothetical protein
MGGLVRATVYWLYVIGMFSLIVAFDKYCLFENGANHTGAPIDVLIVAYSGSAVAGLVLLRRYIALTVERWALRFVVVVGIAGALNLVAFDQLNVMSEYETWSRRGFPKKPAWARPGRTSPAR